tara:strand:- start:3690 stop:4115 length:426 start_codon:yes stop_codon:yes gene_type:complete
MENFTPVSATIGGGLIGVAAVILMAFNGRIAGISGIFSGIFFTDKSDWLWRLLFVIGLGLSPLAYIAISGRSPEFIIINAYPPIILGGLFVGFGTRLGSGCTSGHGVCGVSRLSPRSLVSVVLFMGAGIFTVAVLTKIIGS